MASELGMSYSSLYAKVKAITGETTKSYVTSYRMNVALRLLQKEGLNVSEVAYRVGASSPFTFSREFKNHFGYPPSQTMNDSLHLKYLTVGPNDRLWGTAVNSVGFQEVGPGEPYPPGNHPSRYLFSEERGRILQEYQLLYITKGQGRFRSASLPHQVSVPQGSLLLLFPGEWHTYRPLEETGWREY